MTSFNNILVSIIVPSYNRKETIVQTLDSIIEQNVSFKYEIIIGDDFSSDGVIEVLNFYKRKYPELVTLILNNSNIGLGANWATCVKAATGKYICNCDNDDYWHNPNKLQLQVDFMESNQDSNVVFTNYRNHNRVTGKVTEETAWIDNSTDLQQALFKGNYRLCNATVIYRTDFLRKHVNLDNYIRYQFTLQDWNTWIILAAYTDFQILPVSTATFGVETVSITRPSTFESINLRFLKEKDCYRYVCSLFPTELIFDEKSYDIHINNVLLNLAFKKRNYKMAKEISCILKSIGFKSLRVYCASNFILFNMYALLKSFRYT